MNSCRKRRTRFLKIEKKLKTTSCYVDSTSKSLPRLTVPEALVPGLEDLYIEYIFGKGGLAIRAKVGTETQHARKVWESLKDLGITLR